LENVRTDAPIATLRLSAKPGRPESHQFGLFETTLRNPNQFAETLARLAALCGSDRVGTPVLEATHRPDAFQMKAADFRTNAERERSASPRPVRAEPGSQRNPTQREYGMRFSCGLSLRRLRPPLCARIEFRRHRPALMRSAVFNGIIADARGPFFSSGNWWENNRWWREEWDVETADGSLYRIFRPTEETNASDSSPKSGGGQPHSKTSRVQWRARERASVLECGVGQTGSVPLPLLLETDEHTQFLQPHQPATDLLQYFVEGVYD
jgi:protein ImuB